MFNSLLYCKPDFILHFNRYVGFGIDISNLSKQNYGQVGFFKKQLKTSILDKRKTATKIENKQFTRQYYDILTIKTRFQLIHKKLPSPQFNAIFHVSPKKLFDQFLNLLSYQQSVRNSSIFPFKLQLKLQSLHLQHLISLLHNTRFNCITLVWFMCHVKSCLFILWVV